MNISHKGVFEKYNLYSQQHSASETVQCYENPNSNNQIHDRS